MAWRPILDGALAERARSTIRAIGDDLAASRAAPFEVPDVALFWAYVAGLFDDPGSNAAFDAACDRLIDHLRAEPERPALYSGLAGSAFALAHLSDEADEALGPVDDALVALVSRTPWADDYDLISGLVGYAVYFLERVHAPLGEVAARAGLARIVDQLDALAVARPAGATWFTPASNLPTHQRNRFPDGYYNCGVAHGVPGVLAVLARIAALPDPPPRAAPLATAALAWLTAQVGGDPARGCLPAFIGPAGEADPSRTAWCYGDAGAGLAMFAAARRLGLPAEPGLALVRAAAARDPAMTGVRDAALCHGAVGLAHLYNRAHQATGDPALAEAARSWFARTIDMAVPGSGPGGYAPHRVDHDPHLAEHRGLLEGAAGIGLALAAALASDEPTWDRLLVIDVPAEAA